MLKTSIALTLFLSFTLISFTTIAASSNTDGTESTAQKTGIEAISNYRTYTSTFASAGQPSAEQLQMLSELGTRRVIYLAFSDNDTAIDHEDRIVKKLGMEYVHIPVDFDNPTLSDFETFAAVMAHDTEINTLLHCQVNFRASTFSFLYRTIYQNINMADAKADMDSVWTPNPVWFQFIRTVLKAHGKALDCTGCDWGANEFVD